MLRMHSGPITAHRWLLRGTAWLRIAAIASCGAQRTAAPAPHAARIASSKRGPHFTFRRSATGGKRVSDSTAAPSVAEDDSDSVDAESAESHAEHGEGATAEQRPSDTGNEEAGLPPPASQLDPGLYLVGTPIGECLPYPSHAFSW
jgi:hypothetical protein